MIQLGRPEKVTPEERKNLTTDKVAARFGPTIGPWLVATARGLDSASVSDEPYLPRSRGREATFQEDITDWEQVRSELMALVYGPR